MSFFCRSYCIRPRCVAQLSLVCVCVYVSAHARTIVFELDEASSLYLIIFSPCMCVSVVKRTHSHARVVIPMKLYELTRGSLLCKGHIPWFVTVMIVVRVSGF